MAAVQEPQLSAVQVVQDGWFGKCKCTVGVVGLSGSSALTSNLLVFL